MAYPWSGGRMDTWDLWDILFSSDLNMRHSTITEMIKTTAMSTNISLFIKKESIIADYSDDT